MNNNDELTLLEYLGRGKKAHSSKHVFCELSHATKYYYKSKSQEVPELEGYIPSLADMLQTACNKTQAIFKISSYGKGVKRIAAHLSYISRWGKIGLEDQDGKKIIGTKTQKEIIDGWSVEFGKRMNSRDTMHLVLSAPPGTDRFKAYLAAKEFLAKEYKSSNHEYLFAVHNDTDHPHVHVVIKMVSNHGFKLDPRKAYLNRVRQDYAKISRFYGIQVEASSRAERGLSGQSTKSEFVQMRKKGRIPRVDTELIGKIKAELTTQVVSNHPSELKIQKRNQVIRKRYIEKAKALEQKSNKISSIQEKEKYHSASRLLHNYANNMSVGISRSEKLKIQLNGNKHVAISKSYHSILKQQIHNINLVQDKQVELKLEYDIAD
jgi:type IV secretion system T-DNA border endonuclease VirD2